MSRLPKECVSRFTKGVCAKVSMCQDFSEGACTKEYKGLPREFVPRFLCTKIS